MRCFQPLRIARKETGEITYVACGKCAACLSRKRADWSFRIREELKDSKSAFFVTLTYAGLEPKFDKRHIQLFFKSLRNENEWKIKYFLVSEYGSNTHRPHYHAIIFNISNVDLLQKYWIYGFIHVGNVTDQSIYYVCKYCVKHSQDIDTFSMISKNIGIGYVRRNQIYHEGYDRFYVLNNGFKQPMPRYYAERIYNEVSREKHAYKCSFQFEDIEDKYKAGEFSYELERQHQNRFIENIYKNTKSEKL